VKATGIDLRDCRRFVASPVLQGFDAMSMMDNQTTTWSFDLGILPGTSKLYVVSEARPSSYFRWKIVLGRMLASLLLIPGLPIIGVLVIVVRLGSRGPGVYRQIRTGKGGQRFWMYKIRTMRHDAEGKTGAVWTQASDPRITRLGRILRRLHLDELPQLFNVLKGEMSLIGPRPERPEFVRVLTRQIPGYHGRLAILPGITGLAQINLPPDRDLDSVRRKLVLDLQYVEQASLFLDFRVFLCTLLHLVGINGELAARVTRLRRVVPEGESDRRSHEEPTDVAVTPEMIAEEVDVLRSGGHFPRAEGNGLE
jgi:lipopolysaccharide/colanic/teichoic acid biosynthesis glycosyltransferase